MLCIIDFSTAIYPGIMVLIGVGSLALNWYVTKKANEKFKIEQMDKKADKTYVDSQIAILDKEVSLKLSIFSESTEETKTLLEHMSKQIEFIYQKHYKP